MALGSAAGRLAYLRAVREQGGGARQQAAPNDLAQQLAGFAQQQQQQANWQAEHGLRDTQVNEQQIAGEHTRRLGRLQEARAAEEFEIQKRNEEAARRANEQSLAEARVSESLNARTAFGGPRQQNWVMLDEPAPQQPVVDESFDNKTYAELTSLYAGKIKDPERLHDVVVNAMSAQKLQEAVTRDKQEAERRKIEAEVLASEKIKAETAKLTAEEQNIRNEAAARITRGNGQFGSLADRAMDEARAHLFGDPLTGEGGVWGEDDYRKAGNQFGFRLHKDEPLDEAYKSKVREAFSDIITDHYRNRTKAGKEESINVQDLIPGVDIASDGTLTERGQKRVEGQQRVLFDIAANAKPKTVAHAIKVGKQLPETAAKDIHAAYKYARGAIGLVNLARQAQQMEKNDPAVWKKFESRQGKINSWLYKQLRGILSEDEMATISMDDTPLEVREKVRKLTSAWDRETKTQAVKKVAVNSGQSATDNERETYLQFMANMGLATWADQVQYAEADAQEALLDMKKKIRQYRKRYDVSEEQSWYDELSAGTTGLEKDEDREAVARPKAKAPPPVGTRIDLGDE